MFATAHSPQASRAFAGTYQKVGVETGVSTASPHRLIAMLFEGFNDAVTETRSAMKKRDVAAKCVAVTRAVRIVDEGLASALDHQGGGKLAADLAALYRYVCVRLTHAHLHNDEAALDECVRLMEPVKAAWSAIGSGAQPQVQ